MADKEAEELVAKAEKKLKVSTRGVCLVDVSPRREQLGCGGVGVMFFVFLGGRERVCLREALAKSDRQGALGASVYLCRSVDMCVLCLLVFVCACVRGCVCLCVRMCLCACADMHARVIVCFLLACDCV